MTDTEMVETDVCQMAFSPTEAPVYGGGTIVVVLSEEVHFPPGAELFLAYEGSRQRHITNARQVNNHSLHSTIPCHDCEETVRLSVQLVELGGAGEGARELTATPFAFRYDSAFHLAHFLLASVYNPAALESLELIRSPHFDLASEALPSLDQRLARALRCLPLPPAWHLLGGGPEQEFVERESILHFCANLGLFKVALFLLDKPGSETVIRLPNRRGQLPCDVAEERGFHDLAELLSGYNTRGMVTEEDQHLETDNGVIRTFGSDTTSLTTFLQGNPQRTIDQDIDMLQEVQSMMKRGHSPSCHRAYQSDWPLPAVPEPEAEPNPGEATAYHSQLERALDRMFLEQQAFHSRLEGIANSAPYGPPGVGTEDDEEGDESVPSSARDPEEGGIAQASELGFLEGSLSSIHGINEGLLQLREENLSGRHLSQDVRKENLSRFSSSCPLLDVKGRTSPIPLIDVGDAHHHRSMLDLAEDTGPSTSPQPPEIYPTAASLSQSADPRDIVDSAVRICINDVTVDSSADFHDDVFRRPLPAHSRGGRGEGLRKGTRTIVESTSVRRRSWCPDGGGEEDAVDTQKEVRARMLALTGKSLSLNSLDGEDLAWGEETEDFLDPQGEEEEENVQTLLSQEHSPDHQPRSPRYPCTGRLSPGLRSGASLPEDEIPNAPEFLAHPAGSMGAAVSMSNIPLQMVSESKMSPLEMMKTRPFTVADTHGVRSYDEDDHSHGLAVPHSNMTKSLSTPSIPAATEAAVTEERKGGMRRDGAREGKHAQFRRQDEIEEEEDESVSSSEKKTEISLQDFLNDPSNFESDERAKMGRKEEERKKRKTSVFSRFQSSYRTKKHKDKDSKGKNTHSFVSVSFSNATACDVCHKPMANKPALRCENCLVNVHENNCKDHITPCDKFRNMKGLMRDSQGPGALQERQAASLQGSSLRPTQSFKDKRSASAPVKPQGLSSSQPSLPHRFSLPASSFFGNPSFDNDQSLWHPATTRFSIDHTISEESETDFLGHGTDFVPSNITETQSESMESLDGVSSTSENFADVDDDPSLELSVEEAEAWNLQVDRKLLKKLNSKDIKRQDTIWELIQTEKQYVRSLKVMQKVFSQKLVVELEHLQDQVERFFPRIDDLLAIHSAFLRQLLNLQKRSPERSVDAIGQVLFQQFEGESAEQMKEVYGVFCSKHKESVQLYKDILKTDRKFHSYVKKCSNFSWVKRREVPDFILGVTVRLSKYPILIEAILKSTKDKKDRENLSRALLLSKAVLTDVDQRVALHEQLMDIYTRMDSRSTTTFKGKKFKKQDLLANNRILLHAGIIGWKNARGRVTEVLAVVLSDLILFASESGQRFNFFLQDNKSCVVPLFKLLVREKRDTRDSHGIYLISQNRQSPEMYELVCRTKEEKEVWMRKLQEAISNCPEEEENIPLPEIDDEKKRQEEVKAAKVKEIIDMLQEKDLEIKNCCEEKDRLLSEMLQLSSRFTESHSRPNSQEGPIGRESLHVLQAAIQEASRLTTILHGSGTQLSRSVSSVGEHVSSSFVAMPIPKRAETFAGFDSSYDIPKLATKKRFAAVASQDEDGRSSSMQSLDKTDADPNHSITEEHHHPVEQRMSYPGATATAMQANLSQWEEHELRGSDRSIDQGSSLGELSGSSMSSLPTQSAAGPAYASGQEATPMGSIAQLLKYLHYLMHLTAQQGTAVESLRVQLNTANDKINKLSAEMNERGDRRMGFSHNKLEELRNLQENISREKQEWEKEKAQERVALQREREELKLQRQLLQKQEAELQSKREELKRQREALQRQMDMIREQTATRALSSGSFHSAPSTSTPASQGSPTPSSFAAPPPAAKWSSQSQPEKQQVVHRRSQSADFYKSVTTELEQLSEHPVPEASGKTPSLSRQPRHSMANIHNFNSGGPKANMPMHLLSAKNEQKVRGGKVQQLPLKLSSGTGGSAFGGPGSVMSSSSLPPSSLHPSATQGGSVSVTGAQQVLPFKLASGSHPSSSSALPSSSPSSSVGIRSAGMSHSFTHQPPPPHLGPGLSRHMPSHSAPSLAGILKLAESSSPSSPSPTLPGSKNKSPSQAALRNTAPAPPPPSQHSSSAPGPSNPPPDGADSSGIIYF